MLIDEKRLMRNYTLKPAYLSNIGELDTGEVYKQWFTYAMIGVNKYVELLHKQLVRKGRSQIQNINHPLFKNSYIVKKYNIKSSSTAPYNKENYNDLGLNQFFVGQDPYKPYQGDPSSKNGIYHDICEIRTNYNLGSMQYYYGFPNNLALLFEKEKAWKYNGKRFFYIDEKINFKDILNKALENINYEMLINDIEVVIFSQTIQKNNEWIYPSIDDIKIPEIKVENVEFKPTFGKPYKKLCIDVEKFYNDFKELNKNIFRIEKVEITYNVYEKAQKTRESDPSKIYYTLTSKKISFFEVFNSIKENYKCKYATPLCFYNGFNLVCYEEPYVAYSYLNNQSFGKKDTSVTPSVYPLYRKSSNLPYGRRDRWFALWDSFYYLYVYEKSSKGILSFLAPIVTIILAVATWWIGGQGAWIGTLIGVSENVAAGITLGISLGLAVGSLTGNKLFSILNAVWGLVNFLGAWGANNWNLAADFTKNTAQAAQEMSTFESTLNIIGNLLSGASKIFDVVQSITADTPDMINEQSDDSDNEGGNGSEAEELAKDAINPTLWYNFETADILNEKIEKKEKPIFIF
ncbi:NADH-quinone oxidoreductase subunit H [Campylobacter jejuni]|nr:NADH-quinone oxidoreductase subunit H [Campylobacter jejuni]ECK8390970.1 NADH-quinone oxidoreductase subunit H [Campylobacter jejuni]ECL1043808.1 NADH-quinone oxidoreductase subunit H [Campylobacter jejuni]ECL1858047.1 NADH-quinone oxidoreductase subunit H [Campylobacter jejuni]ECL1939453.1 NADH-quinone oxidoreductase subunit H [Campylobacter jejuni]